MKFCGYCGKQISDDMRFCMHCGKEVPILAENASARSPEGSASQTELTSQASPTAPENNEQVVPPNIPEALDYIALREEGKLGEGLNEQAELKEADTIASNIETQKNDFPYVGKTCPFCQYTIKPVDDILVCPECNTPHHTECVQSNGGKCTTFGCKGEPKSIIVQEPVENINKETVLHTNDPVPGIVIKSESIVKNDNTTPNLKARRNKIIAVVAIVVAAIAISIYFNGNITWTSKDGNYSGQVKWGVRHGKGTLVTPDGTQYIGNWVNGDITEGKLIRPRGAEYEGTFYDGKKVRGTITMPDGTKYTGNFRNDELDGNVVIAYKSGEIIEGEYSHGRENGESRRFPPRNSDDDGFMFVSKWVQGKQVGSEQKKAAIILKDIRVRNEYSGGAYINDWNTRFPKSSIRYIRVTAQVESLSPYSQVGKIMVKYILPNGGIMKLANGSSPAGGTAMVSTSGAGGITFATGQPEYSPFNYGRNYIELYWKGILIGETYFDVY